MPGTRLRTDSLLKQYSYIPSKLSIISINIGVFKGKPRRSALVLCIHDEHPGLSDFDVYQLACL